MAMSKPAPRAPKPVKAWAVVLPSNRIDVGTVAKKARDSVDIAKAKFAMSWKELQRAGCEPIRVLIVPEKQDE